MSSTPFLCPCTNTRSGRRAGRRARASRTTLLTAVTSSASPWQSSIAASRSLSVAALFRWRDKRQLATPRQSHWTANKRLLSGNSESSVDDWHGSIGGRPLFGLAFSEAGELLSAMLCLSRLIRLPVCSPSEGLRGVGSGPSGTAATHIADGQPRRLAGLGSV